MALIVWWRAVHQLFGPLTNIQIDQTPRKSVP
jgi:hypothetical protein